MVRVPRCGMMHLRSYQPDVETGVLVLVLEWVNGEGGQGRSNAGNILMDYDNIMTV